MKLISEPKISAIRTARIGDSPVEASVSNRLERMVPLTRTKLKS